MHTVSTVNISPGVDLTCISTGMFKTGCVSINLISSLKRETASGSALLPRVLRRGTRELPDMERISSALDELYGARVEPIVRKKGEMHSIGFYADFPDDRFIPDENDILEKTVLLAGDMLLSPALDGGLLRPDYVESEKKNLVDDIRAGINDKRGYSIDRLLEEMCAEEAYSVKRLGSEQEAQAITAESLTAHYRGQLNETGIKLLYCGAADPGRIADALRRALRDLPARGDIKLPETKVVLYPSGDTPVNVTEKLDVSQGKLAAGFRMGNAMKGIPDLPAMMVFNAVYGSGATSKLFLNVREKLSLCYYVGSMLDRYKGVMIVSAGVDASDFGAALDEIILQLDNVKNGDVSDWELLSAKRSVITALRSAMDRPSGLLDLYYDSLLSPFRYDPAELCAMVDEVTLDRVVETASDIKPDTVYCLEG